MKQRSTMLKVVSIIYIVIGALDIISGIMAIAMRGVIEQTYAAMGIAPPSTLGYALTFIAAAVFLASGIVGLLYRSKQSVLILGIIFAAYEVFSIVYAAMTTGFSVLSLISLIWPILYLWGWYQSN